MKTEKKCESAEKMTTMIQCIESLTKKGYTNSFNCLEQGLMTSEEGVKYEPHQIKIVSFYRFEGMSDPQDGSILYAIETVDAKKGYLVNGYAIYADEKVSNFILEVEEIEKRIGNKQPSLLKRMSNWFKR